MTTPSKTRSLGDFLKRRKDPLAENERLTSTSPLKTVLQANKFGFGPKSPGNRPLSFREEEVSIEEESLSTSPKASLLGNKSLKSMLAPKGRPLGFQRKNRGSQRKESASEPVAQRRVREFVEQARPNRSARLDISIVEARAVQARFFFFFFSKFVL
jgi:hypothetical protein